MDQYGLENVDDDMEVTHSEYKEQSEKRKKLVESTNAKIKKSLEAIKESLDGQVDGNNDEGELLKALLKLAILKKAV